MGRPSKHAPEVRERAVRMVFEHTAEHLSQWAAIRSVGEKLGIRTESLRRWVRQAERDAGQRPGLTTHEREELKRLQHENVELKRANEILRKASALFAQAELRSQERRGERSFGAEALIQTSPPGDPARETRKDVSISRM